MNNQEKTNLSPKDYASSQEVRWCPGCGDYAILKTMTQTLSKLQLKKEDTVFVSGIGCASRFPYYLDTYGFHTIHGRAPAVATGVKLANPNLSVWVITGDGDGLSIGGNHLMHALRRNIDINILLFNNEIYGLTKGQFSPTSRLNTRSPSSPEGSLDSPVPPCKFALGSGASFVARAIDKDKKGLGMVLERSYQHSGATFTEILQNCIVYNDGVFNDHTGKEAGLDKQLHLEHGQPMLFGEDKQFGLALDLNLSPIIVDAKKELSKVLIHDETNEMLALMLLNLNTNQFPMAFGVLYANSKNTYEKNFHQKQNRFKRDKSVLDILKNGTTWKVD